MAVLLLGNKVQHSFGHLLNAFDLMHLVIGIVGVRFPHAGIILGARTFPVTEVSFTQFWGKCQRQRQLIGNQFRRLPCSQKVRGIDLRDLFQAVTLARNRFRYLLVSPFGEPKLFDRRLRIAGDDLF